MYVYLCDIYIYIYIYIVLSQSNFIYLLFNILKIFYYNQFYNIISFIFQFIKFNSEIILYFFTNIYLLCYRK